MQKRILTFDIGGKAVKYAIFSNNKLILAPRRIPIHNANRQQVVAIMKAVYKKYQQQIGGIAIAAPGAIRADGVIYGPSAIRDWINFNLKDEVAKAFSYQGKITVLNDANAAAYADYQTVKPLSSVVTIAVGTGVGAGVIINGKLVYGRHGYGGEAGLMVNASCPANHGFDYQTCSVTGGFNNLETRFYNRAMVKKLGAEIFALYDCGDKHAKQVVTAMYKSLALTIFNIFVLLDPDYIFLAGGLSRRTQAPHEIIKHVDQIKRHLKLDIKTGVIQNSPLPYEGQLWGAYKFFIAATSSF